MNVLRFLPNALTITGWALGWYFLATGMVAAAFASLAFDVADGAAARHFRAVSGYGADLDWLCDVSLWCGAFAVLGFPLVGVAALPLQLWLHRRGTHFSGRALSFLVVAVLG